MATISPDLSGIVDGAIGDAADWTTPMNTIISAINGNLDNTNIASGAGIAFTKLASAQSGAWTSWTPSFAGFSANPSVTSAKYVQLGKTVHCYIKSASAGTSNATTFTVTLPVAASASVQDMVWSVGQDNSADLANPGLLRTTASSTTLNVFKTSSPASTWTNSGSKYVNFSITYEAL